MLEEQSPRFVSAADITRNFGMWQDKVSQGPICVTHHGRPRVVMLSVEAFQQLSGQDNPHGEGEARPSGDDGGDAARLQLISEHFGGSLMIFDRDLCFRYVNSEAAAYLGQPLAQIVGRSIELMFPRGMEGPFGDALRRVSEGGEAMQLDMPSEARKGQYWRLRFFPFPDGAAIIARNVTKEMTQEHEAAANHALQAAREAHGRVGVARLSVRATFEFVEAGLAKLAGFGRDRLVGIRFTDLLALNQRATIQQEIEAVLSTGETRTIQTTMLVNGGGELSVCVALAPIREGFGIVGAMLVLTAEKE